MTFKKVFGLLLILIILAAGGIYLLMIEKADDDRMRSLYTEVEPLEREREVLIEEKTPWTPNMPPRCMTMQRSRSCSSISIARSSAMFGPSYYAWFDHLLINETKSKNWQAKAANEF